jgi:hypothetical protein
VNHIATVEPSAPGENYSLLTIGESKIDGDGSEVDGDGGDGDGDRWRWLWGHFPIPAGCENRGFCPPKFVGGGGRAAELFWGKTPIPLGFSVGRLLIGEGASSGGNQGGLTIGGRGQGLGRAPSWCG